MFNQIRKYFKERKVRQKDSISFSIVLDFLVISSVFKKCIYLSKINSKINLRTSF